MDENLENSVLSEVEGEASLSRDIRAPREKDNTVNDNDAAREKKESKLERIRNRKQNLDKSKKKKKIEKEKIKHKKKQIRRQRRRKSKKSQQLVSTRQTTCTSDAACLELAVKYMKQVKDNVRNFNAQKSRIEKFLSLGSSKAGKKGEFDLDLSWLKEAGGGNASALKCQNASAGEAAIKEAIANLASCPETIKAACETNRPAYDKAAADDCAAKMSALVAAVDKCFPSGGCTCWKAADIKAASDAIANCSLVASNGDLTKFKNNCTSSFSACRQVQDKSSSIMFACNGGNTPEKLIAKLKTVTDNKAALEGLKTDATAQSNKNRIKRAASCGDFIRNCNKVAELAKESISNPTISSTIAAIRADLPTTCTADEKAILSGTVLTALTSAVATADVAIAQIQNDISGKKLSLCHKL